MPGHFTIERKAVNNCQVGQLVQCIVSSQKGERTLRVVRNKSSTRAFGCNERTLFEEGVTQRWISESQENFAGGLALKATPVSARKASASKASKISFAGIKESVLKKAEHGLSGVTFSRWKCSFSKSLIG